MGLKFKDILINKYADKEVIDYLHQNKFKEFLLYSNDFEVKSFDWSTKTFPLQKKLGIEKHEFCKWTNDSGIEESFVLERNARWIRIGMHDYSRIDEYALTNKLRSISEKGTVGLLTYNSTSDSANIWLYKSESSLCISWNCDLDCLNIVHLTPVFEEKVYYLPEALANKTCGEEFIYYYWLTFFQEIPVRYFLVEPSLELVEFLRTIRLD